MTDPSPTAIVLAGPNGAGKTTASRSLLADRLGVMTFVNADTIALGLSGFDPERVAISAGRILLQRMRELVAERANFAFETTLAGRTYAPWIEAVRRDGYAVHLVYFWLDSADLAVARVVERVRQGGHHIPEPTIRQRYRRSVRNFIGIYRGLVNSWIVFDNSVSGLSLLVARGGISGTEVVLLRSTWERMLAEADL